MQLYFDVIAPNVQKHCDMENSQLTCTHDGIQFPNKIANEELDICDRITIDGYDLDKNRTTKNELDIDIDDCEIENMRESISATFRFPISPVGIMRSCKRISPSLVRYTIKFKEFEPGIIHLGLDDCVMNASKFKMCQQIHGKDIIKKGCNYAVREFLKTGCPQCLRPVIWKMALYVDDSASLIIEDNELSLKLSSKKGRKNKIEECVSSCEDDVFNILNDPTYFPFHDKISKTFKRFCSNKREAEFAMLHIEARHEQNQWNFPTNISSSNHLIYLLAPLSLVFENENDMHDVFQVFYSKFWTYLNPISANKDIINYLCKAFEDLMLSSNPFLFNYMLRLNCQPLSIALPWILTAFSQYLEIGEVLHLWDRIIAFGSLELLPLLASSIFLFRSEIILRYANNKADVVEIFSDGSTIKVIPLLRIIMFPCSI